MKEPGGYLLDKTVSVDGIAFIRYFELSDTFTDVPEEHEAWEMVYIDRGECNVIADDNTMRLKQGELYFHRPHERHMLQVIKGFLPNAFIICFYSNSPAMYYLQRQVMQASLSTKQHIAALIHEASNTFEMPFNDPHMNELNVKRENRLWAGDQTVFIRLELMLIELIRKHQGSRLQRAADSFSQQEVVTDEVCRRIIDFMEVRLYEKTTLEDISEAVSASKSFVSKHFNEVMHCPPMAYFNKMKVDIAKRLIRENKMNLTQISEKLLFSNVHYLSVVFKRYTGMTPSQYKRSCKIL